MELYGMSSIRKQNTFPAALDFYSLKEVRGDWAEADGCPLPGAEQTNRDISPNRQVVVSGLSKLIFISQNAELSFRSTPAPTGWFGLLMVFTEGRYGGCCGGNIIK